MTAIDWYAEACERNSRLDLARKTSDMSLAWARPLSADRLSKVQLLKKILDNVRGIARSHGLPTTCEIKFATARDNAAGCAGFYDAPESLTRPFIYLCKSPLASCEEHEVLDVYCGLAIHEASHILFTRDFYINRIAGKSSRWELYRNLFEDERIEALARLRSPGYSALLQATKHVLIERPFEKYTGETWDSLPDMDKVEKLIFAFVRCPHRLSEEQQSWCTYDGRTIFQELRGLFSTSPESEVAVVQFTDRCWDFWRSIRSLHPDLPRQYVSGRFSSRFDDEASDRLCKQLEADARDRVLLNNSRSNADETVLALLEEVERFEASAREATQDDQVRLQEIANRLFDLAAEIDKSGKNTSDRLGRRFALPELSELIEGRDCISGELTASEATELAQLEYEQREEGLSQSVGTVEFGDKWNWEGTIRDTIIEYSKAQPASYEIYEADRRLVLQHSRAMRQVLQIAKTETTEQRRQLTQGAIDRRQIAKGLIDHRVFKQTTMAQQDGLAICLMVDESGSMQYGSEPKKWEAARQVVAMFVEALGGTSVELEVYTYSSAGLLDHDCLVRYCYGRKNKDIASFANFVGKNNYDHQALATGAELFQNNTSCEQRWMFVISDGMPYGEEYEGQSAIDATRQSVKHVRQQGIRVINIAIEDFASEQIFGQSWVLKFTDLPNLVVSMRRMLTTLV